MVAWSHPSDIARTRLRLSPGSSRDPERLGAALPGSAAAHLRKGVGGATVARYVEESIDAIKNEPTQSPNTDKINSSPREYKTILYYYVGFLLQALPVALKRGSILLL